MGTASEAESSARSLFGRTRRALLARLYGNPGRSFYLRQLVREVQAGQGSVQRELRHLVDAGVVVRRRSDGRVFYQANRESPVFSELRGLVLKTFGVGDIIRAALSPLKKHIQVAFVYGSIASQSDKAESDLDLMIIGNVDFSNVVSRLSSAEKRLHREVNPAVYSLAEWRTKLAVGNHFLDSVLKRKKLFMVGSEDDLRKLSAKRLANRPSNER